MKYRAAAGVLGSGTWTMAISGVDGCGVGTKLVEAKALQLRLATDH